MNFNMSSQNAWLAEELLAMITTNKYSFLYEFSVNDLGLGKIYGGKVSDIIGIRKRVYRTEWGASGHSDRRDWCQNLRGWWGGAGQPLIN